LGFHPLIGCRIHFQSVAVAFAQACVAFFPVRRLRLKTLKPLRFSRSPQSLGEHLIKRRMEFRLLLREAAEHIGADVFSLINWEKGKIEPANRFWPGIIAFLGYDPSPLPVTLGDHIRAERRRRGCSLALLARECGFTPGTLALIQADNYPRIDPRVLASYEGLQGRYGLTSPLGADDRQTAKP
jgi:hypothetical protein